MEMQYERKKIIILAVLWAYDTQVIYGGILIMSGNLSLSLRCPILYTCFPKLPPKRVRSSICFAMIEVKNLIKYYQDKAAVDNVSFKIDKGETMVLLGTSGCGKTTTLKMINRLIEPSSGEVWVDGRDVRSQKPEILRRNIGYVIQSAGLFPHYTVAQNIRLVPSLQQWPEQKIRQRIEELMSLIGLDHGLLTRYPHELSGGQQQRVGLARALAADPRVVLLDEPFGALDPITKQQILQEFLTLEALKKKTMLMVTHDVFEAAILGDIICLMDRGSIQQIGSPHELIFHPRNQFVREFFHAQRFRLELLVVKLEDILDMLPATEDTVGSGGKSVALPAHSSLLKCLDRMEQEDASRIIVPPETHQKRPSRSLSREQLLQYFYKFKEKLSR